MKDDANRGISTAHTRACVLVPLHACARASNPKSHARARVRACVRVCVCVRLGLPVRARVLFAGIRKPDHDITVRNHIGSMILCSFH